MLEKYPDLQLQIAQLEPLKIEESSPTASLELSLQNLDIIYVYGLSDGHPFLQLEEWLRTDPSRQLIFLEDDLQAVHRLCAFSWSKRMLHHPQVHLKFLYQPKDCVLELCARQFPSRRIAVTTLKKKTKLFQTIRLALLRKTVLWHSLTSERLSGHLLHRNIFTNFQRLPGSFYVNQTKGAFAGIPAVICGAGPSLSSITEELKTVQEKALIIGCGSALSALSYAQLKPHIGLAIDPNAREKECLQGCQFRDIPLIYGNRLYPAVFDLFDGPYGYIRSPTGSPLEKAIEKQLGFTEADVGLDLGREALSITTLALSLACFWGCSPIILAGVDLAYSGGIHYAQGVPVHPTLQKKETNADEQLIYRKGAEGKRVATLVKWVMEQQTIDAYTRHYPHITFLNATGKGLGFPSIPHQPLHTLHLPSCSIDISKLTAHKTPVTSMQLQATLLHFKSSFESCLKLAKKLQKETEGSGKAILYEDDLSHEKAYQLALQPALEALETTCSTSIGVRRWKFLQEIAEEYIQII
jgi:hypothetical protein